MKRRRGQLLSKCCIAELIFCAILYFLTGASVSLVLVGGVAQAFILPFLLIAALYFRDKQNDKPSLPGRVWSVYLWLSAWLCQQWGYFNDIKNLRFFLDPLDPAALWLFF